MIASRKAVSLIAGFESFRAQAYQDSAGVWTIGFGTTKGVKKGDKIDVPNALNRLMDDMAESESAVTRFILGPLQQHEFDALVSFTYNVGSGALSRSTLRRLLNEGNRAGAANEFDKWVYAGKSRLAGLVKRRSAEKEMFLG